MAQVAPYIVTLGARGCALPLCKSALFEMLLGKKVALLDLSRLERYQ
jgi:hypothetical protein